ncbi:hypothetical protein Hanom_Chr11g01005421 [Helianthus anomalus]
MSKITFHFQHTKQRQVCQMSKIPFHFNMISEEKVYHKFFPDIPSKNALCPPCCVVARTIFLFIL